MEFSYNFRRKPHRATIHQDNVPLQLRCSDYVEVDHIGSGEDDTENHIAATIQFHRDCFDCGATRENQTEFVHIYHLFSFQQVHHDNFTFQNTRKNINP